jgi:heat shock protein HtpX
MFKSVKTFTLLAALSGLLLAIGALIDGGTGGPMMTTMLIVALAMNFLSYFYSDRLAIKMARAEPMDERRYPDVYAIVRALAQKAGEPMPRLYISPSPQLNAFATGRNPSNAAVCINQGLYDALDRDELEGVIGHELQHVYNRDILIGSVAAMIATAITYLAFMLRWIPFFGSDDEGPNPLAAIAVSIIAPLAAMIIQASITRSRESLADHTGAELTGKPLALASALAKLEAGSRDPRRLRAGGTPAETSSGMQHLFIAAPFGGRATMSRLFSTHPPIPERIAALEEQARQLGQLGPGPRRF